MALVSEALAEPESVSRVVTELAVLRAKAKDGRQRKLFDRAAALVKMTSSDARRKLEVQLTVDFADAFLSDEPLQLATIRILLLYATFLPDLKSDLEQDAKRRAWAFAKRAPKSIYAKRALAAVADQTGAVVEH